MAILELVALFLEPQKVSVCKLQSSNSYPMAWCEVVQNLLAPRMIDSMLCRLEIIASLSYDFHNAFISYSSEVGKALFRTAIREI